MLTRLRPETVVEDGTTCATCPRRLGVFERAWLANDLTSDGVGTVWVCRRCARAQVRGTRPQAPARPGRSRSFLHHPATLASLLLIGLGVLIGVDEPLTAPIARLLLTSGLVVAAVGAFGALRRGELDDDLEPLPDPQEWQRAHGRVALYERVTSLGLPALTDRVRDGGAIEQVVTGRDVVAVLTSAQLAGKVVTGRLTVKVDGVDRGDLIASARADAAAVRQVLSRCRLGHRVLPVVCFTGPAHPEVDAVVDGVLLTTPDRLGEVLDPVRSATEREAAEELSDLLAWHFPPR